MNILVTGATGYVGSAVCRQLLARGYAVTAAVRHSARRGALPEGVRGCVVGDIGAATEWEEAVRGADAVAHLAARVHLRGRAARRAADFRETNLAGTRRLATEAARLGVGRLVFVSTIAVNGRDSAAGELTESSRVRPGTAYARSKWQAEQALREVSGKTGIRTLVLRPPVVYGAGAPGSFSQLVGWIRRGLPVPVAGGRAPRSMIYVDNLAAAVADAMEWHWEGHALCLIADAERIPVSSLAHEIARRVGRKARVLPVPISALKAAAALSGRRQLLALGRPLEVSIRGIRDRFGWTPPLPLQEGLDRSLAPGSA